MFSYLFKQDIQITNRLDSMKSQRIDRWNVLLNKINTCIS